MPLFRKTPPEYRALVVENEREFRGDLVYTIESLDVGISVVAEAADYEDARELIDTIDIDLLITDINLTDLPRFEVGSRDGTTLARYARDQYDVPSIFLTAFADYDPEVVAKAALSDPIGFIQKQGAGVGTQVQQLILLAMRRLEMTRKEQEATQQLESVIEHVADALVFIDRKGQIIDFDDGTMALLKEPGEALLDQHWEDVMRFELPKRGEQGSLKALIEESATGFFPALSLKRSDGQSILCSLRLAPSVHLREPCSLAMIRSLERQAVHLTSTGLPRDATLCMVGFGRSKRLQELEPSQLRILTLELRAALLGACRRGDFVSRPYNSMVAVVMPDTDEDSAHAIARSLIASAQGVLGPSYPAVTLRGGIARRDENSSASKTIAAAIDALDQAERSVNETVARASDLSAVQQLTLEEFSPRGRSSRIGLGYEITARILDVPTELAGDLSIFNGMIDNCMHEIAGVWGYSLCSFSNGGRGTWTDYRPLASRDESPDPDALNLDAVLAELPERLSELYGAQLPSISFHEYEHLQVIAVPLTHNRESCGLIAIVTARPEGDKPVQPANERELQLARVAGEHLGPIVKRIMRPAPSRPIANIDKDQSYNLYSLREDSAEVLSARLYLEMDTPIAVVGETGMHRSRLLSWAAETRRGAITKHIVLNGSDWADASQKNALTHRISARESCLLVIRDPHRMDPSLQALLATVIRERAIPGASGVDVPLSSMRFAVTLPETPTELGRRDLLDRTLISVLGAGQIILPSLRELSRKQLLDWANNILQHEGHRSGRSELSFDSTAEQAMGEHSWPGNVQELQDRIHDAVMRSPRDALSALDLGLFQLRDTAPTTTANAVGDSSHAE